MVRADALVAVGPCRGDLGPPGGGRTWSRSRSAGSPAASGGWSPTPSRATLQGLAFDLDDGEITIVGGGQRDAVEIRRTERYAFGRVPETTRSVARRRVQGHLALPDLAAGQVHRRLPGRRARQRRARDPHDEREGGAARLPRHRQALRDERLDRHRRLLRERARRPRRRRLDHARRDLRPAPDDAALRVRATSARRSPPASTTSTPRARPATSASAASRPTTTRRTPSRS